MVRSNALGSIVPSRRAKTVRFGLLLLATVISVLLMSDFATEPNGYVAGYTNAVAMLFALAFALVGLALLIWRITRTYGAFSVISGVWLIASYSIGINVLYRFDLVRWKNEKMVSLLPQRGSGYYVYFKRGTSQTAINEFSDRVLHDRVTPRGQDLKIRHPKLRSPHAKGRS